jgi:hypothetical protein
MAAGSPNFLLQLWLQAASSALVQLLSAGALACGAMALGLHLPLAVWAFVIAPVFLMAALPVSVGGWGTREAAAVAALAPFGVPAVLAVGVGLLYGVFALGQGLWELWPWACRAGLRTEPMLRSWASSLQIPPQSTARLKI